MITNTCYTDKEHIPVAVESTHCYIRMRNYYKSTENFNFECSQLHLREQAFIFFATQLQVQIPFDFELLHLSSIKRKKDIKAFLIWANRQRLENSLRELSIHNIIVVYTHIERLKYNTKYFPALLRIQTESKIFKNTKKEIKMKNNYATLDQDCEIVYKRQYTHNFSYHPKHVMFHSINRKSLSKMQQNYVKQFSANSELQNLYFAVPKRSDKRNKPKRLKSVFPEMTASNIDYYAKRNSNNNIRTESGDDRDRQCAHDTALVYAYLRYASRMHIHTDWYDLARKYKTKSGISGYILKDDYKDVLAQHSIPENACSIMFEEMKDEDEPDVSMLMMQYMFKMSDALSNIYESTPQYVTILKHVLSFLYHIVYAPSLMYRMTLLPIYYDIFKLSHYDKAIEFDMQSLIKRVIVTVAAVSGKIKTESSVTDKMRSVKSLMLLNLSSPAIEAIKNLLMAMISLHLFSKDFSRKITKFIGYPPKSTCVLDTLSNVFEDSLTLVDLGETLCRGGDITPYFEGGNPIYTALCDTEEIIDKGTMTATGRVDEFHVERMAYVSMAQVQSKKNLELLNLKNINNSSYIPLKKAQRRLLEVMISERNKFISAARIRPVFFAIVGSPSAGKQMVLELTWRNAALGFELNYTSQMVYVQPNGSEYHDGYDTYGTPFFHCSEPASKPLDRLKREGDDVIQALLPLVDANPMFANMAECSLKGKVPLAPIMVTADSNNLTLAADELYYSPSAGARRPIFVHVKTDPNFVIPGTESIDTNKSRDHDSFIGDRYIIDVYKYQAKNTKEYDKVPILTGVRIFEYMEFVRKTCANHVRIENELKSRRDDEMIYEINKSAFTDYMPMDDQPFEEDLRYPELADKENGDAAPIKVESGMWKSASEFPQLLGDGLRNGIWFPVLVFCAIWSYLTNMWNSLVDNYPRLIYFLPCLLYYLFYSIVLFCFDNLARKGPLFSYLELTLSMMSVWLYWWQFYFSSSCLKYLVIFLMLLGKYFAFRSFSHTLSSSGLQMARDNAKVDLLAVFGKEPPAYKERSLIHPKWKIYVGAAIGIAAALKLILSIIKMCSNEEHPGDSTVTEPMTTCEASTFHTATPVDLNIQDIESKINAGKSRKRVLRKDGKSWCEMQGEDSLTPFTGTIQELNGIVTKNVVQAYKMLNNDTAETIHILGIKGNIALINTHFLNSSSDTVIRISSVKHHVSMTHYKETIISSLNSIDLGNDITVVALDYVPFKDIIKHISLNDYNSSAYTAQIGGVNTIAKLKRTPTVVEGVQRNFYHKEIWSYDYAIPDRKGKCGLPLLVMKGSRASVVGIHSGGVENGIDGYASVLDQGTILAAVDTLIKKYPLLPMASMPAVITESFAEPIPKSPFLYETLDNLQYYGKAEGPVIMPQKSKLVSSGLGEGIRDILYKFLDFIPNINYGRPMMRPAIGKTTYISPYNINLNKVNATKKTLDLGIVDKVINILFVRITTNLEDRGVTELAPLDMETAINGIEYDDFTRRINASTAGGHGWPGSKSKYLPPVNGDLSVREPIEKVRKNVVDDLNTYLNGEINLPVHDAQLKDEPRESSKCKEGKTRVYYCSPLIFLIIQKMFLSPFYTLMVEFGDIFCTKIGIDMHSSASNVILNLTKYSKNIMEGDYGGFDVSMPPMVGHAVNTLVHRILRHFGYTQDALKIVQGIFTDLTNVNVEMNKDRFAVFGLQPSGKYATAEDNSLRGLFMLMYVWYEDVRLRELDFFEYVLPALFGDDVLAGVKDDVKDWFNNLTYAKKSWELLGIEYTSSSKTKQLETFVNPSECTFLKRKFVYRHDISEWVAPLDLNSVIRAMEWILPSSNVSKLDQVLSTTKSMLRELVLRCDEITYLNISKEICQLVSDKYMEGQTFLVPSYHEVMISIFGHSDLKITTESQLISLNPVESSSTLLTIFMLIYGWYTRYSIISREGFLAHVSGCRAPKNNLNTFWEDMSLTHIKYRHSKYDYINDIKTITKVDFLPSSTRSEIVNTWEIKLAEIHELITSYSNIGLPRDPFACRRMLITGGKNVDVKLLTAHIKLLCTEDDILTTLQSLKSTRYKFSVITTESAVMDSGVATTTDTEQNIHEIAGEDIKEVSVGESIKMHQGEHGMLLIKEFFERPIEITSGTFTNDSHFGYSLPVWDYWSLIPSVRAKLKNYAFFRGTLHIRFACSGTPFHYGWGLLSYQPWASYNETLVRHKANAALDNSYRPLLISYLSQAPGSISFNVNENMPIDIEIPFISPKPMHCLYNKSAAALAAATSYEDFAKAGDLCIYSINPPGSVAATSTDSYFQVYAWMTDVELGCTTGTQIAITTESGIRSEVKTGPIETIATRAAQITKDMGEVPIIGPYAKASSMIASGIGRIAALLGWSTPNIETLPSHVKSSPFQNGAHVIQAHTGFKLSLDPLQETTVDPSCCGTCTDDMSVATLGARNSYLATFSWPVATAALSTPLYEVRVTPSLGTYYNDAFNTYVSPIPACFAAALCQYWRADMEFTIQFAASRQDRGKMAIFFDPNISQVVLITGGISLNKQNMLIVDIQQTQSITFVVKHASEYAWLKVSEADEVYLNHGTTVSTTNGRNFVNGFFFLTPFTKLQRPSAASMQVNIYARAINLQLAAPCQYNMPLDRAIITESLQCAMSSLIDVGSTPSILNPSSARTDRICEDYMGEQLMSLRSLGKRFITNRVIPVAVDATNAAMKTLDIQGPIYPPNNLAYNVAFTGLYDVFSYTRYAYLGIKGSVKFRILPHFNGTIANTHMAKVSMGEPSTALVDAAAISTTNTLLSTMPGTALFVPATNAGIEFECPYYSQNLFAFCFSDTYDDGADTIMETAWFRNYLVQFGYNSSTFAFNVYVDNSFGEDFTLMRFQGSPYYTYTAA